MNILTDPVFLFDLELAQAGKETFLFTRQEIEEYMRGAFKKNIFKKIAKCY